MSDTIKADIAANVAWYTKHRTKIWGTIWFIAGLVGGNTDRLYDELSKPFSKDADVETLKEKVDSLEKRILKLETEQSTQKFPFWSGSMIL